MSAVFAVLGDRGLEPGEARQRVSRIALDNADSGAEQTRLASFRALIGVDAWPDRRLLITAVNAATGEPVVWDRARGITLPLAVTASTAFPGTSPPSGTSTVDSDQAPTPISRPEPARWS